MSAFTEPLAQVREKLGWLIGLDWDDDTDVQKYARESLAALTRVEQQATQMEAALEQARECCARPPGVCFEPTVLVVSAFAEPLTQVREATVRNGVCLVCGSGVLDGEHLRDDLDCALDRVERLASDMETALRPFAEKWDLHAADYLAELIDGKEHRILPAHVVEEMLDDIDRARAVLSAREEGADTR